MQQLTGKVVVVTGASAGIGRASAKAFAQRGAKVALIARGITGLNGALAEIEKGGGTGAAYPCDVADVAALRDTHARIERELGPIDVWVNAAFASVFAPFWEISPEEFRRVTEVSYLGFVNATMVALSSMRERGEGTIVQVGSALGERAIPLQSAYCGAKHAINGFTESLRCELMHEKSKIRVTVVQMPAVNTPQFSWVRSRLSHHPQPVPPIYQPEVAARAVLHAALRPGRKQYWVGATTAATLSAQKVAPALLDRYLARTGFGSQQSDQPTSAPQGGNLFAPLDGADGEDYGAHGVFDDRSHPHSVELFVSEHPRLFGAGALAGAVAGYRFVHRSGRVSTNGRPASASARHLPAVVAQIPAVLADVPGVLAHAPESLSGLSSFAASAPMLLASAARHLSATAVAQATQRLHGGSRNGHHVRQT